MKKNRYVNTRFWDDSYIFRLGPNEKLLFLYLLTNPLTNIAGVYEIVPQRIANDTGLPPEDIAMFLDRLEANGKIARHGDWIGISNFARHQKPTPNIRKGIAKALDEAPPQLSDKLPLTVAVAFKGFESLSEPKLKPKRNPNLNDGFIHRASTGLKPSPLRRLQFPNLKRDDHEGEDREGREGW